MKIWVTPLPAILFFYLQTRRRLLVLFYLQGRRGQIAKASNGRRELRTCTMIWILEHKNYSELETYSIYAILQYFASHGLAHQPRSGVRSLPRHQPWSPAPTRSRRRMVENLRYTQNTGGYQDRRWATVQRVPVQAVCQVVGGNTPCGITRRPRGKWTCRGIHEDAEEDMVYSSHREYQFTS